MRKNYIPAFPLKLINIFYNPFIELFFSRSFKAIAKDISKEEGLILDAGCGSGTLIKYLLNEKIPTSQLIGVDIDENILKIAKKNCPKVRFLTASALELPFESESVKHVIFTLSLHHIREGERLIALKEAHRVLMKGGKLIIFDFVKAKQYKWRIFEKFHQLIEDGNSPYLEELTKEAEKIGLKNIETKKIKKGPFLLFIMLKT